MTAAQAAQPAAAGYEGDAVVVRSLSFSYPESAPVVDDFSLSLPRGSRCLLCGANGAGERIIRSLLACSEHAVDIRVLKSLCTCVGCTKACRE